MTPAPLAKYTRFILDNYLPGCLCSLWRRIRLLLSQTRFNMSVPKEKEAAYADKENESTVFLTRKAE